MKNKKLNLKNKITNHILTNGKKATSEKVFTKSCKEILKSSKKQIKKLFQTRISLSTPIFKLHQSVNKKRRKKIIRETPTFIPKKEARVSLAIKFLLLNSKKRVENKIHKKIEQETLKIINKESTDEFKNSLQKKVLLKKSYFRYYRWT